MSGKSLSHSLKPRITKAGVLLAVRLTPKAAKDEIAGIEMFNGEAVLKARVRALPEDGRANEALVKLIAAWLCVPRSSVSIAQGGKSRLKHVLIEGEGEPLSRSIDERSAELQ